LINRLRHVVGVMVKRSRFMATGTVEEKSK